MSDLSSRGREWELAGQAEVRIVSKGMVIPAKPTRRHNFFLSCLDILWTGIHYNQRVIFYEGALSRSAGDGGAAPALVEALKSSLALCLVHYYPWCGRLSRPGAAAAAGDRLFIDCNDAGVEFVEAAMDLPISRLSMQGFQTKPFYDQLCQKVDHTEDGFYSSPLLSVQATFFSDGGLSLGVSQSHIVADGQALWDFMVSWGECARGLPLSRHPIIDRQVLALQNLPLAETSAAWDPVVRSTSEEEEEELKAASNSFSQGTQPSPEDKGSVGTRASSPDSVANSRSIRTHSPSEDHKESAAAETPASIHTPPHRTHCVFILPSSAVTQLKIEDGGIHTSFEVTCAHLWQRLTIASQRPPHEPSKVFILANYRGRMQNPPLSPAYFGNAVGFGMKVTTTRRICNESLHATASRIHDTVVQTLEESRVIGLMHFIEANQHDVGRKLFAGVPKGLNIGIASSTRFPVYEVDFGWGKPAAVRSPKVPGEGELVFFGGNPKLGRGDAEICSFLPTDVLRLLLKDPSFLGIPASDPFEDE